MMRRFSILSMLLLFTCSLTGCGDSHDKVMADMLREMNSMVTVLEGIESKADAEAAKGKLEQIGKRMKSLSERAKKLGDPSPDVEKKLEEKYKKEMGEVMMKFMAASMNMAKNPEIAEVLEDSMKNIQPGL